VAYPVLIAIVLPWTLITSPFSSKFARTRSWRVLLLAKTIAWMVTRSNRKQSRAIFGETRDSYNAFMKSKQLEPVVEEIGEDARLLWVGAKVTERVILYLHGKL